MTNYIINYSPSGAVYSPTSRLIYNDNNIIIDKFKNVSLQNK